MAELKGKQKKFADEYLLSWNAADAARKAGYSENSAASIGSENLRKPHIAAYIRARAQARDAVTVAAEEELMAFLSSVVRGNVMDQFGLEPTLADRLRAAENLMKRYMDGGYKYGETKREEDPLSKALREEAERMQNGTT